MNAIQFLKQYRVYNDDTLYNSLGEIVGTTSQIMNEFAQIRALEFTKWKDDNYVTYKIRGLWDGKFYAKNADYWASKGKTSEQLFNEWNNLNNKQQP